jgi:hypothetical protein
MTHPVVIAILFNPLRKRSLTYAYSAHFLLVKSISLIGEIKSNK